MAPRRHVDLIERYALPIPTTIIAELIGVPTSDAWRGRSLSERYCSAPERRRRGLQALRDTLSAVRASIVGGEPIPIGSEFERHVKALVNDLIHAVERENVSDPHL